jgi:hypothetical protein
MSQSPYAVGRLFNSGPVWDQMNFIDNPAPAAPAGGLSMGQMGGMLNLANMFLGQSAMRNTMGSMAQAQQTAGLFGDIGTGRDYHAAESDLERQMRVARYAPKFTTNDPFARQSATRDQLLAGKYAFDAFVG